MGRFFHNSLEYGVANFRQSHMYKKVYTHRFAVLDSGFWIWYMYKYNKYTSNMTFWSFLKQRSLVLKMTGLAWRKGSWVHRFTLRQNTSPWTSPGPREMSIDIFQLWPDFYQTFPWVFLAWLYTLITYSMIDDINPNGKIIFPWIITYHIPLLHIIFIDSTWLMKIIYHGNPKRGSTGGTAHPLPIGPRSFATATGHLQDWLQKEGVESPRLKTPKRCPKWWWSVRKPIFLVNLCTISKLYLSQLWKSSEKQNGRPWFLVGYEKEGMGCILHHFTRWDIINYM